MSDLTGPKILSDTFPAIIAMWPPHDPRDIAELTVTPPAEGAYQVTRCRVIVTQDRIIIAKDSPEGPVPIFSEAYTEGDFQKSKYPGDDSYIVTEFNKKLAWKKDDSCGCGSRLRSWNPYNVIYSSKDPTE